jgi:hypothetical protein
MLPANLAFKLLQQFGNWFLTSLTLFESNKGPIIALTARLRLFEEV